MKRRPRFVGVDEQTRIWRRRAHSLDTCYILIVAAQFQLENWQINGGCGGICHSPGRVETDCERCLDLLYIVCLVCSRFAVRSVRVAHRATATRNDWNVRQLPSAFA